STLGSEALQALVALGYLSGDAAAPAGEIDPRDVIDVIPLTWGARQALARRRLRVATRMIDRLESRMPGAYGVDTLRAQLAQSRGRHGEAYERYADLYLRAPSSRVAQRLGQLALRMGRPDEAAEWYSEALDLHPISAEAMSGLVRALYAQG